MASDGVYEWLVALLESVRRQEPSLPICVIPFNSRTERIATLQDRYSFELLPEGALDEIDEMGRALWPPHGTPLLRKIAAFHGPLESFLFLDSDIVVLESLGRFFDAHQPGHLYYFLENRQEVYDPGSFRGQMVADRGSRGLITGQWGGLRGVLTMDDFHRARKAADQVRDDSFFGAGEQTFLNFAFDLSPAKLVGYSDILPGIGHSWAGARYVRTADGLVEELTATQRATGSAPMLHWAGYALSPTMPHFRLWARERLRSASGPRSLSYLVHMAARHFVHRAKAVRNGLRS